MPETREPKRAYHHGDLRRAVIDGALEAIQAHGPTSLSLREVARRAGVSHAAPAHHFGDKAGVLTTIANEGFNLLAEHLRSASDASHRTLLAGGTAYVRFALGHRAHFEVMFRPDLYRADDPNVSLARQRCADVLFDIVRATLHNASDDEIWGGVLAAWSFTHGFATLSLNANFDAERQTEPEAAVQLAAAATARLAQAGAFDPATPSGSPSP